MYFSNQITKLTIDEYAFLSENFEFVNKEEIQNGVGYIIFNRKRNILNTVKKVIKNELSNLEKELVIDYWGKGLTVEELTEKYVISRASVYRNLNNAKKKIEKFIKYVLVYEDSAQQYSVADFLNYIKGENIGN